MGSHCKDPHSQMVKAGDSNVWVFFPFLPLPYVDDSSVCSAGPAQGACGDKGGLQALREGFSDPPGNQQETQV